MTTKQLDDDTVSVPQPDPTVLTTQQLLREVLCVREILETRLDGMDKAIELLQKTTDKFPAQITESVERLQELHAERFSSIGTQFKERDTRTEQTQRDTKTAVDAALAAQVKSVDAQNISNSLAISKSEAGFTKQIDQIGQMIAATTNGVNDKIDDIKSRLTTMESRKQGGSDGIGVVGSVAVFIAVVVSVLVGVAALVVSIVRTSG